MLARHTFYGGKAPSKAHSLADRLTPTPGGVCTREQNGGAPKRCHNTLSLPSIPDKNICWTQAEVRNFAHLMSTLLAFSLPLNCWFLCAPIPAGAVGESARACIYNIPCRSIDFHLAPSRQPAASRRFNFCVCPTDSMEAETPFLFAL
jgi:hypothetical protein